MGDTFPFSMDCMDLRVRGVTSGGVPTLIMRGDDETFFSDLLSSFCAASRSTFVQEVGRICKYKRDSFVKRSHLFAFLESHEHMQVMSRGWC